MSAPTVELSHELVMQNTNEILDRMEVDLAKFCTRSGVGGSVTTPEGKDYAVKACRETLEHVINDLRLSIDGEDWGNLGNMKTLASMRDPHYADKEELRHILERVAEGGDYYAEKDWGVEERRPYNVKEKGQAERIGQQIFDIFKGGEREFLNSLGSEFQRGQEASAQKNAIRLFLSTYEVSLKRRVEQLR